MTGRHDAPRSPRRVWLLCAVLGVMLLGVAGALLLTRNSGPSHPAVAAVPVVNTGTVPATRTVPSAPASTAHRATTAPRPQPMSAVGGQLAIPRLGVTSERIDEVGTKNGVLDVPLDPHVLGWWTGGATPGSGAGSVVIDGHINYNGVSGTLSVLPQLRVGDTVQLTNGGHTLPYRVSAVRTYDKAAGLPVELFARTGSERLVLITCGGPFDASTGNYEDNIVAFATPATT
jgi:sortase (surface protein transpeptidase)